MFDLQKELLPGLPAYEDGRMSDAVYHSGYGLHPLDGRGIDQSWENEENKLENMWMWSRFALMGCDMAVHPVENDGIQAKFTNGRLQWEVLLRDDVVHRHLSRCNPQEKADAASYERAVTGTHREAFCAYLQQLESAGFCRHWSREADGNLFVEMTAKELRIYCAYWSRTGTAHFINDRVSDDLAAFCESDAECGAAPVICQYGLHYGEMASGITSNCGMLYIVQLCDRSLFVVDGGEISQATDSVIDDLMHLMRRLSGTEDGSKIPVAAWFCTHPHCDHMDLFTKLLRFHHEEVDLRRIIFNYPDDEAFNQEASIYLGLDRLTEYYPHAAYLKPHAGQCFELGGVQFDILQTHEDSIGPRGTEKIGCFNDTSTILKLTYDGASFLFLGDMDEDSEALILKHYSEENLRAQGVQVAHHLINELHRIYRAIAPKIAVVPQHEVFMERYPVRKKMLLDVLSEDQVYFACRGTDLFRMENGEIVHAEHIQSPQSPFDGSYL